MNLIPLPYRILAGLVILLLAAGGGYYYGSKHTGARIAADLARTAAIAQKAQQEALQATAKELAAEGVKYRTIREKTEVITREVPVYRDCQHDDRTFGLLNDALSPAGAKPAGGGKLP